MRVISFNSLFCVYILSSLSGMSKLYTGLPFNETKFLVTSERLWLVLVIIRPSFIVKYKRMKFACCKQH